MPGGEEETGVSCGRRGQVAILLAFALAALTLLVLMNVDTFLAMRTRGRLQNAGDAAALAAARKQGELLNEIGTLNLEHVLAAARDDTNECRRIVAKQRRLALCGPLDAVPAASDAAARNGAARESDANHPFSQILREHARTVRTVYTGDGGGGYDPFPEPYPGAWMEYAAALERVATGDLAAGPESIFFHYWNGGHTLLDPDFYRAIAAKNWCWFLLECKAGNLLETYDSWHDWAPLPDRALVELDRFQNSEVFSLGVAGMRTPLLPLFTPEQLADLLKTHLGKSVSEDSIAKSSLLKDPGETWFFLSRHLWHTWFDGSRLVGDDSGYSFPLAGDVKPEYNVLGASAGCFCAKELETVLSSGRAKFSWSAAAKPFGSLRTEEGETAPATAFKRFALPCFTDVRLVPCDTVARNSLSTADPSWVRHVREHLPLYMEKGPFPAPGCWYCIQLTTWESEPFRRTGRNWLKFHPGECHRVTGPGGGGAGGVSRGH